MRPAGRLRRRIVPIAVGLVVALVAGLVAVAAFRADGYATTSVDLEQRSVWVTSSEKFMVGRINRQIDELDSAAVVETPAMDVLQQQDTVVVIDTSQHQARPLDVATVSLGGRLVLPADPVVALGGDRLAIGDPATGAVWTRPAAGLGSGDLTAEKPVATVAPGVALAVSATGTVWAAAPGGAAVTTLTPAGDGAPAATSPVPGAPLSAGTVADPRPVQLAMVGDRAVLLDRPAHRLVVLGGTEGTDSAREFPLPSDGTGAVLQQSGPAADGVLVATDRALLRVDLSNGEVSTFDAATTGTPVAPVWVAGCAHAAWGGTGAGRTPTYLQWCGSVPAVRPIPGVAAGSQLRFRVNRDVVVLNDMNAGNSWVLDEDLTVINNWDDVAPPQREDTESSETGQESSSDNLSTARTDCSGGIAPPDPEKDAFGIRGDRPSVLRVLDNDQTSACSMVIVTKVGGLPAALGTAVVVDGGQAVQVTPAPGVDGPLPAMTYTVDDGAGHEAEAALQVTVDDDEPAPPKMVRPSALTLAVGATGTYNALADWMSPSGDPLFLVGASINNDDDRVTYRPDGNITVDDKGTLGSIKKTVTFLVSDGVNQAVRGQLIVDVISDDKADPVTAPVYAKGLVGEPVTISPLESVVSPSTEPLRLVRVDPPEGGGLKLTADLDAGQVTVVGGKPGSYYLDYQVAAGTGAAEGLIRVDVEAPSEDPPAPVAMTDTAYLPVGGEVLLDLTANDVDPAGRALAVQQLSVDPSSGLVVTLADMHLARVSARRAVPPAGLWFSYQISAGGESATGWVRVVAVPAPAEPVAPIASPIKVTVRAGDAVTIPVAEHAVDPGGDLLSVLPFDDDALADVADSAGGLLFTSADAIRYLAPERSAGDAAVRTTYTVVNRAGRADSAPLQITVVPTTTKNREPRTPPVTVARVFTGASVDVPLPIEAIDPDGDWAMLTGIEQAPQAGRASVAGAATLRYTAFGVAGPDTVSYTVSDPSGAETTGIVKVVVVPRPKTAEPPVAPDVDISMRPERAVAVDLLSGVSDPGGLEVTFGATPLTTKVTAPPVSFKVTDDVVVLKAGDDEAVVPITYTVVNERGLSATGVLTVTVSADAPAVPPTAADVFVTDAMVSTDGAAGTETVTATVDVTNAIGNPGGLPADLELSLPTESAAGAEVITSRSLRVPVTDHRQVLAYRVTNLDDLTAEAFVVVPARDELVQAPDPSQNQPTPQLPEPEEPEPEPEKFVPEVRKALVVDAGTTVDVTLSEYIGGLREGRTLSAPAEGRFSATSGAVTRTDAQTVRWTVPEDAGGDANLSVTVSDGVAPTVQVNIPATITPKVVPPPEFASAPLSVEAGTSASIDLAPLVTTADDEQRAALEFDGPTGGADGVTASLEGSVLAVSAAEDVPRGTQVPLEVSVSDGSGLDGHTVPATVTVTVTGLTAPLATVADHSIDDAVQGVPSTVDVLSGSVNPLEGPLRLVAAEVTAGDADVSFTPDGAVTVTPGADQVGRVTVTFTVADASGDDTRNVTGTVTATVRGRPERPDTPKVVSVDDSNVVLEWSAPEDNGSPVTGYLVRADGAEQACPRSPCRITGLTNNQTYAFTVTARNAIGDSEPSPASAGARPDTAPRAPAAPTLEFDDRAIDATWTEPDSDGSPVTGYIVQISPAPESGKDVVGTSDTSARFTGLVNGTQYQVTVIARNDSGTDSEPSPPATEIPATVPDVPPAPTLSTAEEAGAGNKIDVSWTAVGGNGDDDITYTVHWSGDDGDAGDIPVGPGEATSATISPITLGVNYTARVTAQNKAGPSEPGPTGTVSPYTAPAAVADLVATATGTSGQVALTWSAPDDHGRPITAYQFHTGDGQWQPLGADTSHTVDGLADGTGYGFVVRACNTEAATNCGGDSAVANQSPYRPADAVGGPAADADAAPGQLVLSWTPPAEPGRPIAGYQYAPTGSGDWTDAGGTSVTVTGLTNGTSYGYDIRAYTDESAQQYGAVATVSGIPYDVPGAPTGLAAAAGENVVTLTFAAPAANGGRDVTGYQYQVDGAGNWQAVTSGTAFAVGDWNDHSYTVRAVNQRGAGAASNAATAKAWGPVQQVTNLRKSGSGQNSIDFAWDPPPGNGVGGFRYQYKRAAEDAWADAIGQNGSRGGLSCGNTYTVQVRAVDRDGHVGAVASADWNTDACPPPPQTVTVGKYGNAVGHTGSSPGSSYCGHSSCQFIQVTLSGWPNERITCNWSGTTYNPYRNGDGVLQTQWYYGNPGGVVTVTCSSPNGGSRTDSLTW